MIKKSLSFILIFTAIFIMAFSSTAYADDTKSFYVKIIEQDTSTEEDEELGDFIVQELTVEVYSEGNFKGRTYTIENKFSDGDYNEASLYNVGDKLKVEITLSEEGYILSSDIINVVRYHYLIWVLGLFFVLLIVIGRLKGLKTIISLVITALLVAFVMLPLLEKGYTPIPITIGICILASVITFVIMSGFTKKATAAITGTAVGLLSASGIAWAVTNLAHMTGIATEDASYLMYNTNDIVYNLKGVLLAGVLIGCLGAVMDVSMSVASSVFEVGNTSIVLTPKELFRFGMNVGCDVIGTMANTLILAYTGSSLLFILVLMNYDISFIDMLNHEYVMVEVLRALAGSIGMLLAVPGTALISALMLKGKNITEEENSLTEN